MIDLVHFTTFAATLFATSPSAGAQLGQVRVQEMMSYLTLQDVIVARGTTGLHCKRGALHRVGPEAVTRSPNRMTESSLRTLWSGVWKAVRKGTISIKKQRRCDLYAHVRVHRS